MDVNFISDLCAYCTEDVVPPQDAKQAERFFQLEQQFIDHMGYDFVMEYQAATDALHAQEFDTAFLNGLQFAVRFMLTVLPPQ